jgi:hypothetical protein
MNELIESLVSRLGTDDVRLSSVIPWSSPVPVFGDLGTSTVATLGLNPSNREFVDANGRELEGASRRFHTLRSLDIASWGDARIKHIQMIVDSCRRYFAVNPYDTWFRRLDDIIGARASFYGRAATACHLDLIPYATARKWTELVPGERSRLLRAAGDTLGVMLRDSSIRVLLLNGRSVIEHFVELSETALSRRPIDAWGLPRSRAPVLGYSYRGRITRFGSIPLRREVLVLGYNHNIQSSFGVTTEVVNSIRQWFGRASRDALA